jgi:hypothetical protein
MKSWSSLSERICLVRNKYEQDKSLGLWVMTQRGRHANNIMRQDRKELLDEIGFVWRVEKSAITSAQWNKRYEKLVKFKRKNGNCLVPQRDEEDATLGMWASEQRVRHADNKMRPDRKELLDELEFVGQVIIFLTFVLFLLLTCVGFGFGIVHQPCGSPKRSTRRNGTRTRPRAEEPALPKAEQWSLGQTEEAMLQLVVLVLWRKMVAGIKKIQNRLR